LHLFGMRLAPNLAQELVVGEDIPGMGHETAQ
jgi:hypothetical protein